MIKIRNLYKIISGKTILNDINLDIEQNKTTVIIGPSGSGKSTLLRCLNLLERPTKGKIFIDDLDITNDNVNINLIRQQVGIVFQHFNLFNNMNAVNNIILAPRKIQNINKYASIRSAYRLLKKVNLVDKAKNMPYTLSGGEKQRLAIARALATNPKYLLFDEPTSALDPEMIQEVLSVIKNLTNSITPIIISHEINFVKTIADNIIFIENGNVILSASKDDFFNNSNSRITNFLAKITNLK